MLDSGAFTNFTQGREATSLEGYAEFCEHHQDRFWRIVNLDRIGDPETSRTNLHYLHGRGIPVIPVFQRGDDPKALQDMAQEGFPVCIGGISQNTKGRAEQDYIQTIMRLVDRWGIRVHMLGLGGEALFKIPCWSGDSSSWEMASRYGTMHLWYRGRMHTFSKSPSGKGSRSYVRPTLERTEVLRSYGLTWEDLRVYRKWSVNDDSQVYIASIRSWIRLARTLARVNKRYVFAAHPAHLEVLERAWTMERRSWV